MQYMIRCKPMHLFMVLYLCCICECGSQAELWLHIDIYLCASSLQNLTIPQVFYSPLSVTVERSCSPVFDGMGLVDFKRAGPVLFYWPKVLNPILFFKYLLFICFLSNQRYIQKFCINDTLTIFATL